MGITRKTRCARCEADNQQHAEAGKRLATYLAASGPRTNNDVPGLIPMDVLIKSLSMRVIGK
jgi:hypothetical protein